MPLNHNMMQQSLFKKVFTPITGPIAEAIGKLTLITKTDRIYDNKYNDVLTVGLHRMTYSSPIP